MKPDLDIRPRTVREQAAEWFSLKRSGQMTAQEACELQLWLDADPAHGVVLDRLEGLWRAAGTARADPELMAVREAAVRERRRARARRRLAFAAMAASLAVVVGAGWGALKAGLLEPLGWPPPAEQEFHTGLGQTQTVNLPDGSVVTLDTGTVLRASETRRRRMVALDQGRAFFRVAKDPTRPFVVSAQGKTVTATGTAFDVRVDPGRFAVTLVEGRVTVAEPRGQFWRGQSAALSPGWRLEARDDRQWTVSKVNTAEETSWLNGWLTFNGRPLEEVAAELNRYSARKIVIADPAIARTPIVGGFRAGDVDGLVKMAKAYRLARVGAQTDAAVDLVAPRK